MTHRIVFLYPSQGSQQVGMGLDLYEHYPEARMLFERADRLLGFSLSRLCFHGPGDELNRDLNAQMTIYTVSCILTDLLKAHGICPDVVSGYSSGFYAAAYAAGCYDFEQGLLVVRRAGEILLEEGGRTEGSMGVIFGLSPESLRETCSQVGNVDIAILNTPRQTVISGLSPSVKRAMALSLEEGALDAYPLPAQIAYHSRFMEKASQRFLGEIEKWDMSSPRIPLVSYSSLKPVTDERDLKEVMAIQLNRPVRWIELIRKLNRDERTRFIEVGPGAVLSRTLRWVDRNILFDMTGNRKALKRVVEKYQWRDPAMIRRILPHREPFLFVDRVLDFEPGKRILAEKDLTPDEVFFAGHFPGKPIMPGVLVSEALAQTSGLLLGLTRLHEKRESAPEETGHMFLTGVNLKYPSTAEPGDTLVLESELRKSYGGMFLFQVSASVDGRKIASGTLSLAGKRRSPDPGLTGR